MGTMVINETGMEKTFANINLNLFFDICSEPHYLSWWAISYLDLRLIKIRESMVRLNSNTSLADSNVKISH